MEINNHILELISEKRQLLLLTYMSMQEAADIIIKGGFDSEEKLNNIKRLNDVVEELEILCDGDYDLLLLYDSLSQTIEDECYEESANIRKSIHEYRRNTKES